jgi:hypothetical protein
MISVSSVSIVLNTCNAIDFVNFLGQKAKVKGTGTMLILFLLPVENHDGRIMAINLSPSYFSYKQTF